MKILYYDGGDASKRKLVKTVLDMRHCPYTMIERHQGNRKLAELLDETRNHDDKSLSLPDKDLMIFADSEDAQILEISQALFKRGAHVERKCVVTKCNREWRLAKLLAEILEEQDYFAHRMQCQALIQEVASLTEDDYTSSSWKEYEAAFMKAALLFQEDQPSKARFAEAIAAITQAKERLIKR